MKRLKPTGIFVRIALLEFLIIGGLIGLASLLAPFTGISIESGHRLQHIHLQVWYFLGGFVLGAGFRVVPQLTGQKLPVEWLPSLLAVLYAVSGGIWTFLFPFLFPDPGAGKWILLTAALLELFVWVGFVVLLIICLVRSGKKGWWKGITGGGLMVIVAAALSSFFGWSGFLGLISGDTVLWYHRGYRTLIFVGIPLLAMGISGTVLRKKGDPDWAYLLGVVMIACGATVFADLLPEHFVTETGSYLFLPGCVLFGWGIQFHRQKDRLNIPGFSTGVVVAFSFVLLFVLLFLLRLHFSVVILYRGLVHVWVLGFLTTLIIAYATWIVPSAAGRVPVNSPSVLISIFFLAFGTIIRVFAPTGLILFQYGSSGMDTLMFAGGLLQYTGVAIFAVSLWPHLPSVWASSSN